MAWRGHGSPGEYGVDLQNGPKVGTKDGLPAQSYVLGMPSAKLPIRPVTANTPGARTGVPGTPIGYQAGNPSTATWDVRQRTTDPSYNAWVETGGAKQPGNRYGGDPIGKPDVRMPFQEDQHRGGVFFANEKLVTRDRHVFFKVGYENSGRGSGLTDPPMDGPPRPVLATVNRTINWQQGTVSNNAAHGTVNVVNGNPDDLNRGYQKTPTGQWLGEQGSGWAPVYGGVPGMYQPYGSYGGYTAGPVRGIQSPVAQGAVGDGPRKVFSGPPHGMHSPTLPDYALTYGYYQALPLPRAPRQDRPDNTTSAGQSYSQTVVPQGQTGTMVGGISSPVSAARGWMTWRGAWGR